MTDMFRVKEIVSPVEFPREKKAVFISDAFCLDFMIRNNITSEECKTKLLELLHVGRVIRLHIGRAVTNRTFISNSLATQGL